MSDGTDPAADIDPEAALSEADAETVDTFLAGSTPGPLAVVGAPFAGRGAVLDWITDALGATRRSLDPGDGADRIADALDGPLVVDGCQHLYRRTVGGFEPLERVLDLLSGTRAPVVTGWNRYAWAYLDAVRDVGATVPESVEVGPLDADALAELLLARYDDTPQFGADDNGEDRLVRIERRPVAGIEVPVPVFERSTSDPDPEDVVFERLAAVAEGNVGVATALWERSRGREIRPSDIATLEEPSLDRETAFCLRVVLAKERVTRAELDTVVGERAGRAVGRLRRAGLVAVDEESVTLEPAAVPTAVAGTDRERIL